MPEPNESSGEEIVAENESAAANIKKERKNVKLKIEKFTDDNNNEALGTKKKLPKAVKHDHKADISKDVEVSVKLKIKKEPLDSPTKCRTKVEGSQKVVKRQKEKKISTDVKWIFMEHNGPVFEPPYEGLPSDIKFYYDGREMMLSKDAEEIACFYAKLLNHKKIQKRVFKDNFLKDWRKVMTEEELAVVTDLSKCDFKKINSYLTAEKKKRSTKEMNLKIKEESAAVIKKHGFCTIDGHKEKLISFKVKPAGIFIGRGDHPKMGMISKRIRPEDVIINCAEGSEIPKAPEGHNWKRVQHNNKVTWLASWIENVQGQVKYMMLSPSSKLKRESDLQKYETARKLHKYIGQIRDTYQKEWKAEDIKIRQRAVALYFIDNLAFRAGHKKDEDQADTVGCCNLRVEHVLLHKVKDGNQNVVEFDFLGKGSIRYHKEVSVPSDVYKNLKLFKKDKKEGDDLFDKVTPTFINNHLKEFMNDISTRVFRTYNASVLFQNQLFELTNPDASLQEKISLAYNRANRAAAVLCNHQQTVPKSFDNSIASLRDKIKQKCEKINDLEESLKILEESAKKNSIKAIRIEKKKNKLDKLKYQLRDLEIKEIDKTENKTIGLRTSKLNYLDPRITVAWCKKYDVPIEKIYKKTQREKFGWALEMANKDYLF